MAADIMGRQLYTPTGMAGFFDTFEKLKSPQKPPEPPRSADQNLSVSQVTKLIEKAIRAGVPATVAVRGEISNFNHNRASGHAYFTLKDPDACLNCVMFASEFEKLKFTPQHGMELLAIGSVKIFAPQGRYQLYVRDLQPLGQGALELAFQQLHAKLKAQGLFDAARKKALPRYPLQIAIITSRQTAALQDILKVLNRFPWIHNTLFHVPVQGEDCGPRIAAAIAAVSAHGKHDLILLSRGGGSLEDRWGFNHEQVARAIAASGIPVITGIGHEIDVSIADLVADYHAHTPTEAAQVATQHWRNVRDQLATTELRLHRQMRSLIQNANHRLTAVERDDFFRRPTDRINDLRIMLDDRARALKQAINDQLRQRLDHLQSLSDRLQRQSPIVHLQRSTHRLQQTQARLQSAMTLRLRTAWAAIETSTTRLIEHHPRNRIALLRSAVTANESRLHRAMRQHLQRQGDRVSSLSNHLQALSPQRVLERGYSVTRLKKTGTILRSAADLKEGDHLLTRFSDGEVESEVQDRQQPKLFE
jgi:exodeoxyribonuclease VII large subunit